MAIAKKGTRIIVVGGERYRWVVSPDSGYMALVIERAEGEGQRLATVFEQSAVVTSGVVAAVIEGAQQLGWVPRQLGTELRLWNLAWHPDRRSVTDQKVTSGLRRLSRSRACLLSSGVMDRGNGASATAPVPDPTQS
jgi:hypothetical protein